MKERVCRLSGEVGRSRECEEEKKGNKEVCLKCEGIRIVKCSEEQEGAGAGRGRHTMRKSAAKALASFCFLGAAADIV